MLAYLRELHRSGWFTNHGPSTESLERELCSALEYSDCVAMTNELVALIIVIEALRVSEMNLVVPQQNYLTSVAERFSAKSTPLDSDLPVAVLLQACDSFMLNQADEMPVEISLYTVNIYETYVSCQARKTPLLPVLQDFSDLSGYLKHSASTDLTVVLIVRAYGPNTFCQSALLLTKDPEFAAVIRNIRSSYGASIHVPVAKTGNGRISELQSRITRDALMALITR